MRVYFLFLYESTAFILFDFSPLTHGKDPVTLDDDFLSSCDESGSKVISIPNSETRVLNFAIQNINDEIKIQAECSLIFEANAGYDLTYGLSHQHDIIKESLGQKYELIISFGDKSNWTPHLKWTADDANTEPSSSREVTRKMIKITYRNSNPKDRLPNLPPLQFHLTSKKAKIKKTSRALTATITVVALVGAVIVGSFAYYYFRIMPRKHSVTSAKPATGPAKSADIKAGHVLGPPQQNKGPPPGQVVPNKETPIDPKINGKAVMDNKSKAVSDAKSTPVDAKLKITENKQVPVEQTPKDTERRKSMVDSNKKSINGKKSERRKSTVKKGSGKRRKSTTKAIP